MPEARLNLDALTLLKGRIRPVQRVPLPPIQHIHVLLDFLLVILWRLAASALRSCPSRTGSPRELEFAREEERIVHRLAFAASTCSLGRACPAHVARACRPPPAVPPAPLLLSCACPSCAPPAAPALCPPAPLPALGAPADGATIFSCTVSRQERQQCFTPPTRTPFATCPQQACLRIVQHRTCPLPHTHACAPQAAPTPQRHTPHPPWPLPQHCRQ